MMSCKSCNERRWMEEGDKTKEMDERTEPPSLLIRARSVSNIKKTKFDVHN
jgi:hypothetical protein